MIDEQKLADEREKLVETDFGTIRITLKEPFAPYINWKYECIMFLWKLGQYKADVKYPADFYRRSPGLRMLWLRSTCWGLSQRKFAKMMGTSPCNISLWENGRRQMSRGVAMRAARILQVQELDLLYRAS